MDTSSDMHDFPRAEGPAKRSRVVLSCGACRSSKLKCDRAVPCSNCLKKGRADGCVYAPKPEKVRPTKGIGARLKRLEGLVRDMIDDDGRPWTAGGSDEQGEGLPAAPGQVVKGERGQAYVGATHFMAMLDDIEDLKSYFDEPEPDEDSPGASPDSNDSPDMFMLSKATFRSKEDLLRILPPKPVMDRLIMRYFSSNSPSQHIVHRTAFVKQYNAFWQDPSAADMEWLALLFMVMSLAVFFSKWASPHELQGDSAISPMDRFKQFRAAAGWALVSSKYTSPGPKTIQPFLLYVESEFLINRASQTDCWLLSSVCIRIMLRMGLHRDPSKLANISPFEGETRRRMWHLAIQLDLIVSFHMGLPSMIHGFESDTDLPRNLLDEDFDEESTELPPGRPDTEYTHLSYPIFKSNICRIFGQIARHAHSLAPPSYDEVMRLDGLLEERWQQLPHFFRVRPLEECVADPPMLVVQRFGIGSLYQKSRCVLHRRYLVEAVPKKEHEYSRRTCLQAALALLGYQNTVNVATQQGGMLSQKGWFINGLAMHDFLLAAMVVYAVVQSETLSGFEEDAGQTAQGTKLPEKGELIDLLERSHRIWVTTTGVNVEAKKAADVLEAMLKRIQSRKTGAGADGSMDTVDSGSQPTDTALSMPMSNLAVKGSADIAKASAPSQPVAEAQVPFSRQDLAPHGAATGGYNTWIPMIGEPLDWGSVDDGLRAMSYSQAQDQDGWMAPPPSDDFEHMAADIWNQDLSQWPPHGQ